MPSCGPPPRCSGRRRARRSAFRRAFALAKQTVLGFDSYARQIGKKYRARPCLLEDVLDGLFHIASADGFPGEAELAYLEQVAAHFGFSELEFRRIKATNLGPTPAIPMRSLGFCRAPTSTKCATLGGVRRPRTIPTG